MGHEEINGWQLAWIGLSFSLGFGYLLFRHRMPAVVEIFEGPWAIALACTALSLKMMLMAYSGQGAERWVLVGLALLVVPSVGVYQHRRIQRRRLGGRSDQ